MPLAGLLTAALLQAPAGPPEARSLEPAAVTAYVPADLVVHGSGFGPDCRVLLGAPGKLMVVPAEVVDESTIRVRLGLGLGPQPAQRQLVVECGGRRSHPLVLRVERPAPRATPAAAGAVAPSPAMTAAAAPSAAGAPPTLALLDPARLAAWSPETLTIHGGGFVDGAVVKILANRNAGTSRPPVYEMVSFAAEFLSDTVLTVDLAKGFAPAPRLRTVVIANPDGSESAPLFLVIARRSP